MLSTKTEEETNQKFNSFRREKKREAESGRYSALIGFKLNPSCRVDADLRDIEKARSFVQITLFEWIKMG
jgi:transposase